jgi:hypothetical protein
MTNLDASEASLQIVKEMLAAGANARVEMAGGGWPLYWGIARGPEMTELLLNRARRAYGLGVCQTSPNSKIFSLRSPANARFSPSNRAPRYPQRLLQHDDASLSRS